MRKTIIYIVVIILLFLIPALILRAMYGPSYYFLSGEDCWMPDGIGGWVKHGAPYRPLPQEPSVNIPLAVMYIPVFLPGLLIVFILCMFCYKKLQRSKLISDKSQVTNDQSRV
jgi:hypothetical protein